MEIFELDCPSQARLFLRGVGKNVRSIVVEKFLLTLADRQLASNDGSKQG
jgi:hypothetical protein